MNNPIIPKVAYIPLEYTLSVDEFLEIWNEMEEPGEPTQKDYDDFCLSHAKGYFYDMRGEIEGSIRLMEDN
jgi:hypothetical protein